MAEMLRRRGDNVGAVSSPLSGIAGTRYAPAPAPVAPALPAQPAYGFQTPVPYIGAAPAAPAPALPQQAPTRRGADVGTAVSPPVFGQRSPAPAPSVGVGTPSGVTGVSVGTPQMSGYSGPGYGMTVGTPRLSDAYTQTPANMPQVNPEAAAAFQAGIDPRTRIMIEQAMGRIPPPDQAGPPSSRPGAPNPAAAQAFAGQQRAMMARQMPRQAMPPMAQANGIDPLAGRR